MEVKLIIAKVKSSLLIRRAKGRQGESARELADQAKGLSGEQKQDVELRWERVKPGQKHPQARLLGS